jgi:flagellar protein FliO/FliZ
MRRRPDVYSGGIAVPSDALGFDSLSLALGAVVLLLWGGIWAVRRMRPGAGASTARDCAILRSLALGPRERLLVVRVGARQLVIGVGASAVSLLCELETPLAETAPGDRFGAAIKKAAERWRGG